MHIPATNHKARSCSPQTPGLQTFLSTLVVKQPSLGQSCYTSIMARQDLSRFLYQYDQLTQWPSKHADKALAVHYLATKFKPKRTYSEQEVNEMLKQWHTFSDWPLLRRELYESGYLERVPDGSKYWLTDKLTVEIK
jgi:hypothetical protein